jgi:hypothetical protein
MTKQETSSPTIATEQALMLTCVIHAVEHRGVATCDIPGAFMQSDMKGRVVMKLEGVMAEAILKIDPKQYTKYVVKENGKDVIYVILAKALYGTLQERVGDKCTPVTTNQGKAHDYLGMTLNYAKASFVKIDMTGRIRGQDP